MMLQRSEHAPVRVTIRACLAASVVAVMLLGTLTSCSLEDEPLSCDFGQMRNELQVRHEVAVVEAPTQNFVAFSNVIANAKSEILEAISEQSTQLSVLVADAQPALISTSYVEFVDGDTQADKENTTERAYGSVNHVSQCLTASEGGLALEPESDLLAALGAAASTFKAENSTKQIFMLSNGIQTTGQFPMQKFGIPSSADAATVVQTLVDAGALPDLKGATVNWIGMGQTDGVYQRSLNQQSVDALENFWKLVIAASNGKIGKINRLVEEAAPQANSIPVSTIAGLKNVCFFTLGQESGFSFQPDAATFVDEATARAGAREVVGKVQAADCVGSLYVTGYVASGTSQSEFVVGNSGDVALSLARAEAFTELLVSEGLQGVVTPQGGGKGPENDWNPDGSFNEEAGKLNRIVVVSQ